MKSSSHSVARIGRHAVRSSSQVESSSAVPTNDCRYVCRSRDALVFKQLNTKRIKFKLDISDIIANDLTREWKRTTVPLLQSFPQTLLKTEKSIMISNYIKSWLFLGIIYTSVFREHFSIGICWAKVTGISSKSRPRWMIDRSLPPSPVNDWIFGGGGWTRQEFSIRPGRPDIFLAGRGDGEGVDDAVLLRLSVRLAAAVDAVEEDVESSLVPDSKGRLPRESENKSGRLFPLFSKEVLSATININAFIYLWWGLIVVNVASFLKHSSPALFHLTLHF